MHGRTREGSQGGGSSLVFRGTSFLALGRCNTSWGQASLPVMKVGTRSWFSGADDLGCWIPAKGSLS